MVKLHSFIALLLILIGQVKGYAQEPPTNFEARKDRVIKILEEHTQKGLPGIGLAYYTPSNGLWIHTVGYARLEDKTRLNRNHLFYLQSISKLYIATAALVLVEQGKLDLETPVDVLLGSHVLGDLAGNGITVRMLLNHTSGIPDYASFPSFVSFAMSNLTRPFTVNECIQFINHQPLDFKPGRDYAYSNTNYTLLSMILDRVTGDHELFVQNRIFSSLGLRNSHYLRYETRNQISNVVDAYWDPLNIERPANVSEIQKVNVSSMRGDDGMLCSLEDGILFLKGLMEGKILSAQTLQEMSDWIQKDGQNRYGLGLTYFPLDQIYGVGHSGGGLGSGCVLIYVPRQEAYIFLATNFNTMIEGKITSKCQDLVSDTLQALLF